MTTNTQNHEVNNDVLAGEEDFLAELEAELNADNIETHDIEEISADDVIAADDAGDPEAVTEWDSPAETEKPKAKAKAKTKSKAKVKAKDESEGDDETEVEAKPAAKPRQSLSGLLPSQALHTVMGDKMYDHCILTAKQAELSADERKAEIDEHLANNVDTLAKKVKEKAINTFMAVAGHATVSVYTQVALKMLKDKGEFTGIDLKNAYLARPYSPGTASAQSSQIMQLLPALQIATREGNRLVLNTDSPLFDLLIND